MLHSMHRCTLAHGQVLDEGLDECTAQRAALAHEFAIFRACIADMMMSCNREAVCTNSVSLMACQQPRLCRQVHVMAAAATRDQGSGDMHAPGGPSPLGFACHLTRGLLFESSPSGYAPDVILQGVHMIVTNFLN